MTYIKLFVDYLDAIEPLGDAERGRLFTSLLTYARTGEVPQLGGNERFIFPMMKAQLDRDMAAAEELSATRSAASKSRQVKQMISNETIDIKSTQDKDKDKEEDKDKEKDNSKKSLKRFIAPTPEEVEAYCQEKGIRLDAQYFVDYYEARGWKINGQAMKDWRAAVRTWARRDGQTIGKKTAEQTSDNTHLGNLIARLEAM